MGDHVQGGSKELSTSDTESSSPLATETTNGRNGSGDDGGLHPPHELLRRIFESASGEWELKSSDGQAHRFHKAVLSEQVPHFRVIFAHEDILECVSRQIIIPAGLEVCGAAAEAFLRYVYYRDMAAMASSFNLTCTLVRMGHYYNLPRLVQDANEIIGKKISDNGSLDWFTGEDLWKLYQTVWMWEDCHSYKIKLLENVAKIIKKMSQGKDAREKILQVTSGDPILRDLIVQLSAEPTPPPPPARDSSPEQQPHIQVENVQPLFQYEIGLPDDEMLRMYAQYRDGDHDNPRH